MSWFNLGIRAAKPMYRNLGNGRVLEYLNLGNGFTKSRILQNGQEVLTRTAKVNKGTGERFVSNIEMMLFNEKGKLVPSQSRYFKHTKIKNIRDESGNLLRRNNLVESGVVDVSSKGGYCRTSDVSLISQYPNGGVSRINCTQPNFEYIRNADTSPTIFNWV